MSFSRFTEEQRNIQRFADRRIVCLSISVLFRLIMTDESSASAESGTGLLANVQFVLTFSPLKDIVSSQLLSMVQDEATKLINDPATPPLARRQHRITRDFLTADDVATVEFIMFPGGGRTRVAPTPGSAYITVYSCLMVSDHLSRFFMSTDVNDGSILSAVAPW